MIASVHDENTFDLKSKSETELLRDFLKELGERLKEKESEKKLNAENIDQAIPENINLPENQADEKTAAKQFLSVSSKKLKELLGIEDKDIVNFIKILKLSRVSKSAADSAKKIDAFANGGESQSEVLSELAKELAYLYDNGRLTKKLFLYGVGLLIVSTAASAYQAFMSVTSSEVIFKKLFKASDFVALVLSYISAGINLSSNILVTTKSIMTCLTDFNNYFFAKTPQPDLHKKFFFSSLLAGMTVYPNVYLAKNSLKKLENWQQICLQIAQAISSFMQSLRSLLKIDFLGLNLAYRHDRTAPSERIQVLEMLNAFLPEADKISPDRLGELAKGNLYIKHELFSGAQKSVGVFTATLAQLYITVNYIIGAFFAGIQTQGIDLSKEKNPFKSVRDVIIYLGLTSTVMVSGVTKTLLLSRAYLWLVEEFFNHFVNEAILQHDGATVNLETLPTWVRTCTSIYAYIFSTQSVYAAVQAFTETKITHNEWINFIAGFFGAYGLNANDTKKTLDAFFRTCHKEYSIRNNIDYYVSKLVGDTPEEFVKKLMFLVSQQMTSQQIVELLSSIDCKEDLKTAAASLNGCEKHPERYQKWLYEFLDGKNSNYLQSMLISLRAIQLVVETTADDKKLEVQNKLLTHLLNETKKVLKQNLLSGVKQKPDSIPDDAVVIDMGDLAPSEEHDQPKRGSGKEKEQDQDREDPSSEEGEFVFDIPKGTDDGIKLENPVSNDFGDNQGLCSRISSCWASFFSCAKQNDGYQKIPENGPNMV